MNLYVHIGLWLLATTAGTHGAPKIVGGVEADIEDYPYQVSIEYVGIHICGGSIISSTRILTAAHCTTDIGLNEIQIRAGSSIREQGGQVVSVRRYYLHPEFNLMLLLNDISVVILSTALELGVGVQPIPLAAENTDVPVGTVATVSGWGITETGFNSEHLLKGEIPRMSYDDCPGLPDPNGTACYGGAGTTSCTNDSGGPIAVDGIQVGVVSAGPSPCVGTNGAAYVKVSMFRNFIDNETPDV